MAKSISPACAEYAPSVAQTATGWGEHPPRGGESIETDVRRVADRLRSLSAARLAGAGASSPAPAEAGREIAQALADAALGVEERRREQPPRPRALPVLGDFAVGDQVAVTGHDLVAALDEVDPHDLVWSGPDRVPAAVLAHRVGSALAQLRRRL
jgi:hypothetical protein